jgi:hypothetical protein
MCDAQDAHKKQLQEQAAEIEKRYDAIAVVMREKIAEDHARELKALRDAMAAGGAGGRIDGAGGPGVVPSVFDVLDTLAGERRSNEMRIQQIKVSRAWVRRAGHG